jgi:hypothetical protein
MRTRNVVSRLRSRSAGAQTPAYAPAHDESQPLPEGASEYLRPDNQRLVDLRDAYTRLDWPVTTRSRWQEEMLTEWLNLSWFRGDNPYVWQYRLRDLDALRTRYFVFLRYILDRDPEGLVERLGEDGLFGCWSFDFDGYPTCSRDLLDSVNELYFLDRHLGVLTRPDLRVLDIGAGYGRLAHRWNQAVGTPTDYCCTDAVAESTFLSDYYIRFRGLEPGARVVPLYSVPELHPGDFDLAINVHSFSECPRAAIAWWMEHLLRLEVPQFFLVPNEQEGCLSLEHDGSRLDCMDLIDDAGYRLKAVEPVFNDSAVQDILKVRDHFFLFERTG